MNIKIDHDSKIPKHTQLFDQIGNLIKTNRWSEGFKLPSENQFQSELGVSRSTIRQALQAAMNEGLIEKIMGKGSFVCGRNVKDSNLLGIIASAFESPYHQHILLGVEEEARKRGFNIMFGNSHHDILEEQVLLEQFKDHGVKGILLWPAIQDIYDSKFLLKIRESGIPIVLLDRMISGGDFDSVMSDNFSGSYDATKFLIENASRDIYFVSRSILSITSISERFRGYQQAMRDYGYNPYNPVLVGEENRELSLSEFPLTEGSDEYCGIVDFLQSNPRKKAVIAMNDVMALNIMEVARSEGISIPGELSVFGFDNREIGASYCIPLTTVAQDAYQIGAEATRLLINRIFNSTSESVTIKVPVELIIRDSVHQNSVSENR
jgi:DNA-binding LacI/PurR family transcriptional regulator